MNRWTTYYHEAMAKGLNHEDSKHIADRLYEIDARHDARVSAGEPEAEDYDFDAECSCGRGDGCECDAMEDECRTLEAEAQREARA